MRALFATTSILASIAGAAPVPEAATVTLYRNSATSAAMRLHVASFDAAEGAAYNLENCAKARELFQAQPGITIKFWCEPGRFQSAAQFKRVETSTQFTTGTDVALTCSLSASELAKAKGSKHRPADYSCPK